MTGCRCNWCMREFEDDYELKLMLDSDGDVMRACPDCGTDAYLMEVEG